MSNVFADWIIEAYDPGSNEVRGTTNGYVRDLNQELDQAVLAQDSNSINLSSIGTALEDIVARGGSIENSRVPIIKKQLDLMKQIAQKPYQKREEKIGRFKESLEEYRRVRATLNSEIAEQEKVLVQKQLKVFADKAEDSSKQHPLFQLIKDLCAPRKLVYYVPSLALYAVSHVHIIERIPFVKGFVSTEIAKKTWAIVTVAHLVLQGTFPKA